MASSSDMGCSHSLERAQKAENSGDQIWKGARLTGFRINTFTLHTIEKMGGSFMPKKKTERDLVKITMHLNSKKEKKKKEKSWVRVNEFNPCW